MINPYAEQAQSDVRMDVSMTVNGSLRTLRVEPRTTLLDALRNELGLTGPKKSCDRGECGACTVHIDGRRVLSCMTLAAMHDGQQITTIEGLERDGQLHPVQQAFSATFMEAQLCGDDDIIVVGGGNSAGQAPFTCRRPSARSTYSCVPAGFQTRCPAILSSAS